MATSEQFHAEYAENAEMQAKKCRINSKRSLRVAESFLKNEPLILKFESNGNKI